VENFKKTPPTHGINPHPKIRISAHIAHMRGNMKTYQRVQNIAKRLDVSPSTIWRWVAAGKLPKPIKLSRRVTVWRADEVEAAIEKLGEV